MDQSNRSLWGGTTVFVVAMIGAVLGLTSLTQFPYLVYENGWGAFFIPYIIAIVLIGVPFLILEFGAGFKFKSSLSKLLFNIKSDYEYLGWFIIFVMFLLLAIYICIMGWDLIYVLLSLFKGWGANPTTFFSQTLLHSSSSLYALTYIIVPIGLAVMFIWGAIYFISKKGIDGIANLNLVLVPTMIILFILIFLVVFSLDGSKVAMSLIIRPNWSSLFDYHVWLIAFTQVISVLLLGQAVSTSFASYLDDGSKLRLVDNAWIVALVSFVFQILFTLIVFGLLGAMIEVNSTVNTNFADCFNLLFVLIPTAFNTIGKWGGLIGFAFFLLLFIIGLTTAIALIEPFVSSATEKFGISRAKSLRYICLIGIFTSFVFTTGMGQYLIAVVSEFLMKFAILLAILLEVVIIGWVYGADRLMNTLNEGSFIKADSFWIIFIKFVTPIVLIVLLVFGVYELIITGDSRTLFIDSIVAVIFVIIPLVLTLNLIDNDHFDLNLDLKLHTPGPSNKTYSKGGDAEFDEKGKFVSPYKDKKDKRNGKTVLSNVDLSSSEFDSPSDTTLDDFEAEEDEDIREKSVFGKINMFNKAKEAVSDSFSDLKDDEDEVIEVEHLSSDDDGEFVDIDDVEEEMKKSRFSLSNLFSKSKKEDENDEFIRENTIDGPAFNIDESKNSDEDSETKSSKSKTNKSQFAPIPDIRNIPNGGLPRSSSNSKSDSVSSGGSNSKSGSSSSGGSNSKSGSASKSRFKKAVNFDFDDLDSEETIDIFKLQADTKAAKAAEESEESNKNSSKSKKKSKKPSKPNEEEEVYQDFKDDFFDDGVFGDEGYESLLDDYDGKNNKSDTKSKSKPRSLHKGSAKTKVNSAKGKPKTITISADNFDEDKYYDVEDKGADSVFNLDE